LFDNVAVFAAEIWGTVAQWVSAIGTSGAAMAAAGYYIFDKSLAAKAQARQIRVKITALRPEIGFDVHNHSEHPIFALAVMVSIRRFKDALSVPHTWWIEDETAKDGLVHIHNAIGNLNKEDFYPPPNVDDHTFLLGTGPLGGFVDLDLPAGETAKDLRTHTHNLMTLDFDFKFTDINGRIWAYNLRTGRLSRLWTFHDFNFIDRILHPISTWRRPPMSKEIEEWYDRHSSLKARLSAAMRRLRKP
jgi:hypothetical protein